MAVDVKKRELVCWLLADNQLEEWKPADEASMRKMRVLLKHTLLFNVFDQGLVMSDAQILNNNTLRMLIRTDDDVRKMFHSQMIRPAIRLNAKGEIDSPRDFIDSFKLANKYFFEHERLGEGDELGYVWDVAPPVTFELAQIGKRYADATIDVFASGNALNALGKNQNLQKRIIESAREERNRLNRDGKELGWVFFHRELEQHLSPREWKAHRGIIDRLAKAQYQTSLPAVLDSDSVYAKEHAFAFDLARGARKKSVLDRREFLLDGKLGIAALEKGIEWLRLDDIQELLDSNEASEFATARNRVDGSDASIAELRSSLASYVYRIESRILSRFALLNGESTDGNQTRVEVSFEQFVKGVNKVADFLGIFFMPVSVVSNILNRLILDRFFDNAEKRRLETLEYSAIEMNLKKNEFLNGEPGQKIEATVDQQSMAIKGEVIDEIEVFYGGV